MLDIVETPSELVISWKEILEKAPPLTAFEMGKWLEENGYTPINDKPLMYSKTLT